MNKFCDFPNPIYDLTKIWYPIDPFKPKSDLIDFTLSNARQFHSSKGDPLGVKGLKKTISFNPFKPKSD